jgi:hypothetical protein
MPPKQVDISTLDPRQLQSIHESIENEINNLVQSSVALQRAAGEYGNSGRALQQLSEQKEGMPPGLTELCANNFVAATSIQGLPCRSAYAAPSHISCLCQRQASKP